MISYLGIDPGLNGAFAVVSGDRIKYKMAMPTLRFRTKSGKTKTEIDRYGVLSFLKTLPEHTHATIEEQHPFRKNVSTTCTTCKNYGVLLMALTAAHLHITEVPSDDWQDHFGIVSVKKGGGEPTKKQAFRIAQMLYPNANFRKSERARIADDGIVDSALIAAYCQFLFAPFEGGIKSLQIIDDAGETPLEVTQTKDTGTYRGTGDRI